MVFGVLLAGGVGSRMGNMEKPKQYLNIADRPIIIHTIEKFYVNETFEKILVLCPEQWIGHTKNLIRKYIGETERIVVVAGGDTRNETIMNAIRYIEGEYEVDDDTIILTHDSVRPFVTHRIIEENIEYASKYGPAIQRYLLRIRSFRVRMGGSSLRFRNAGKCIRDRHHRHSGSRSSRRCMSPCRQRRGRRLPMPLRFLL